MPRIEISPIQENVAASAGRPNEFSVDNIIRQIEEEELREKAMQKQIESFGFRKNAAKKTAQQLSSSKRSSPLSLLKSQINPLEIISHQEEQNLSQ